MAKIGSEVFEAVWVYFADLSYWRLGMLMWCMLQIHESGNVIRPELVPIGDTVDGPRRYEWAWKYVAPPPGGDQKSAMLPPTGGWKNFCCVSIAQYNASTAKQKKHILELMYSAFIVWRIPSGAEAFSSAKHLRVLYVL